MNTQETTITGQVPDDLDIGDIFEILNCLFQNRNAQDVLPALDTILNRILDCLDAQHHAVTMKLWRDYFQSLNQNLAQLDKITKTKYILAKIVNNYRDFWQQDDLQPAITQACDTFEKTPVCAVDHNTVYIENPSLAENLQKYFKKYQTAHKVNAGIPHTIKTNSINESKAIMKLVETLQPNTQLPAAPQDIFYRYARMKTLQAMPYRQKPGN